MNSFPPVLWNAGGTRPEVELIASLQARAIPHAAMAHEGWAVTCR